MDVWVSSVAVYGILFGAAAIWYLVKRKNEQEVKRDLHFWTKQVGHSRIRISVRIFVRSEVNMDW